MNVRHSADAQARSQAQADDATRQKEQAQSDQPSRTAHAAKTQAESEHG